MPTVEVTEYSLQMLSPDDLRPKRSDAANFVIREVQHPLPELNRFFYTAVGGDWHWVDRIAWTYAQWNDWVTRDSLRTWVAYLDDTPAGYFELERNPDDVIEIAYFGLLKHFTGQGLGGHLLTECIRQAWDWDAKRVWVHTCSLDHEGALHNYRARGLELYNERVYQQDLPDQPPGPWPGAYSGK